VSKFFVCIAAELPVMALSVRVYALLIVTINAVIFSFIMYKFAAASECETIVFGSARPGYGEKQVNEWVEFMLSQGIQRVCCLLPATQLARYADLLGVYRQNFGIERVCWAPIQDFDVVSPEILTHQILPFLAVAQQHHEKVLIHCSGGIGRTGQVLAVWLIAGRGFSTASAVVTIKITGRNPYEAVLAAPFKGQNPWQVAAAIKTLLDECAQFKLL
jgi:protein-tyrosine phosphatase